MLLCFPSFKIVLTLHHIVFLFLGFDSEKNVAEKRMENKEKPFPNKHICVALRKRLSSDSFDIFKFLYHLVALQYTRLLIRNI